MVRNRGTIGGSLLTVILQLIILDLSLGLAQRYIPIVEKLLQMIFP